MAEVSPLTPAAAAADAAGMAAAHPHATSPRLLGCGAPQAAAAAAGGAVASPGELDGGSGDPDNASDGGNDRSISSPKDSRRSSALLELNCEGRSESSSTLLRSAMTHGIAEESRATASGGDPHANHAKLVIPPISCLLAAGGVVGIAGSAVSHGSGPRDIPTPLQSRHHSFQSYQQYQHPLLQQQKFNVHTIYQSHHLAHQWTQPNNADRHHNPPSPPLPSPPSSTIPTSFAASTSTAAVLHPLSVIAGVPSTTESLESSVTQPRSAQPQVPSAQQPAVALPHDHGDQQATYQNTAHYSYRVSPSMHVIRDLGVALPPVPIIQYSSQHPYSYYQRGDGVSESYQYSLFPPSQYVTHSKAPSSTGTTETEPIVSFLSAAHQRTSPPPLDQYHSTAVSKCENANVPADSTETKSLPLVENSMSTAPPSEGSGEDTCEAETKLEPSTSQKTRERRRKTASSSSSMSGSGKAYICPNSGCSKSFTRRYNLQSHLRCHSGERPYCCDLCSLTFSRKHDLRRHTRSLHSVDRPHLCTHCNLSFARSDALKRHLASEAKRSNGHPADGVASPETASALLPSEAGKVPAESDSDSDDSSSSAG